MVAIEDWRNSIIAREFGAREDDIQIINLTLPASTTITASVSFPPKDVWFKVDTRFGKIDPDVFELTMIPDGEVAAQDLVSVDGFIRESWRCVSSAIIENSIDVKITNMDATTSHVFTIVVRGFLIPKTRYQDFLKAIQRVYIADDQINQLAVAIAKKLQR